MADDLFSSNSFLSYAERCNRRGELAENFPSKIGIVDNPCDFSHKQSQQRSKVTPSLPRWAKGMAYGYCNQRLVLVVHAWLRGSNGEECNLCATFYGLEIVKDFRGSEIWPLEAKLPSADLLKGYVEQPVLVRVVEFAEHPEKGRQLDVRSIVRLQSLNSCLSRHIERRELGLNNGFGKVLGAIRDWELKALEVGRVQPSTILDSECINETIKSRSEVVDTVCRDQRPPVERRRIPDIYDEAMAASIVVTLSGDNVGVTLTPSRNLTLEGLEVFFGTAYFQQAASELRSDHAIYSTQGLVSRQPDRTK